MPLDAILTAYILFRTISDNNMADSWDRNYTRNI
jgi:hypothetical protein